MRLGFVLAATLFVGCAPGLDEADLDGHADDANVSKALDEMKAQASLFKVLGSFPKAIL